MVGIWSEVSFPLLMISLFGEQSKSAIIAWSLGSKISEGDGGMSNESLAAASADEEADAEDIEVKYVAKCAGRNDDDNDDDEASPLPPSLLAAVAVAVAFVLLMADREAAGEEEERLSTTL